ncbi:hypothetical protein ACUNWD_06120 [Sunxiuqinia sp. A32]|uniref:hypothetical protein n=1 Tax=Sunxiuqinia sp. A32 TaxID=3461496 RepID=UPI00404570DF
MEKEHYSRHRHEEHPKKGSSTLGTILIILGLYFILKETGWLHGIPGWDVFRSSFSNFFNIFHFHAINITWPLVLLIVGAFLIMGRRIIGGILVLLAILFFLPGLIIIPGILAVFLLPVLLIILGVIVISRIL